MTDKKDLRQCNDINKIFIYGAGELGRQTYECLKGTQVQVIAFLDKKAIGKIDEIPILSPYDVSLSIKEKESSIVIICLNAGNKHREIADDLYVNGYSKIIFLPLNYAMSYDKKIQLTRLYNKALIGEDIWRDVRSYEEYVHVAFDDAAVIREDDEWIWVWINQEILFSENYFQWNGDRSKVHIVNNGVDVNLNTYYWCHELFDYIDGVRSDCQMYLSMFGILQSTRAGIDKVCDREKLVNDLNQKLSYGMEFFIEAAPVVAWNSKGYFNLVGGHHRTIFLQHKGYVFYPVKMKRSDYSVWRNKDCLEELTQYINECSIQNTYVPVPHPCFMNFPYLRECWGPTILGDILRYLGAIRLTGKKVIDVSQYEGYFARVAKRMCAENVWFYCADSKILSFADKLFKLLKINDIRMTNNQDNVMEECNDANIIFGMLNTRELMKNGCLQSFKGMLFAEHYLDDDNFVEGVLQMTQMKSYRSIQRETFQGRMLEIGVFE